MKGVFGMVGLLLAVLIVGLLLKQQLAGTRQSLPSLAPGVSTDPGAAASAPASTVKDQSQQIQQRYKQAVEAGMQTPRAMPEDK